MSALPGNHSLVAPIPAIRAFRWCADALQLWRRAPFKLWTLCLAQFVIENALQMFVPWAGVILSKIIVPMLIMGMLLGLDDLSHDRTMHWSCLLAAFRRRRLGQTLLIAALVGLSVFALQQLVAWAVYGWPAVDAVLFGHAMAHRQLLTPAFERTLILPGILPSILLLLAPCLFLFDGSTPWQSIRQSVSIALRHALPFGVLILVNLALLALVFVNPWTFVLVLFFLPWSVALTYSVWRDMRNHTPPQLIGD